MILTTSGFLEKRSDFGCGFIETFWFLINKLDIGTLTAQFPHLSDFWRGSLTNKTTEFSVDAQS